MRKAFITWILWQDGPYMAKLLLEKGYKVYGMMRNNEKGIDIFKNTDYLGITNDIEFVVWDLRDGERINNLIEQIYPDEVYNLASQSFVGVSREQAKMTTEVNVMWTLNLLEAVRVYNKWAKYYQAATSEMFGLSSDKEGWQTEETPFHPRNPYAISKLHSYWITNNYKESYDMYCCNGILFNHESPIRGKQFVTRKISDGVARIKLGLADKIILGNIESRRDWWFAWDYVEAMWLMMQKEIPDNYIISTWNTHSIRDFLNTAFSYVWIWNREKHIEIDQRFNRPVELHILHGKSTKAKEKLWWEPKVTFEQLVVMMVEADIQRLSSK